jgi:predicted N-acetyltransferase YhbS
MATRTRIVTSTADRSAAVDIMREAFRVESPPPAVRAGHLGSAFRTSAEWWLLEEDGEPAAALLSYPLLFRLPAGDVVPGFGLGSVGTLVARRGRGHASALCRAAADHAAAEGAPIGLLFSAIPARYYERLGYAACEAWDHVCTKAARAASSGPVADLVALDPRAAGVELARLHDSAQRGRLHLHRDAAAWERTLIVSPDWWFGLGDPDGRLRGYVRVKHHGRTLGVREVMLEDRGEEAPVLRALAKLAADLDCEELRGWLDPSPFVGEWFEDRGRDDTLPMVTGTDAAETARFLSSDYF